MTGMSDWQGERAARLLLEADAGWARRMQFTKRLRQGVRDGEDHLLGPHLAAAAGQGGRPLRDGGRPYPRGIPSARSPSRI